MSSVSLAVLAATLTICGDRTRRKFTAVITAPATMQGARTSWDRGQNNTSASADT